MYTNTVNEKVTYNYIYLKVILIHSIFNLLTLLTSKKLYSLFHIKGIFGVTIVFYF